MSLASWRPGWRSLVSSPLPPLLAATVMIYGLVGDVESVREQVENAVRVLPPDAAHLVETQWLRIVSTSGGVTGLVLVIALMFALYGAMRVASGMISSTSSSALTGAARLAAGCGSAPTHHPSNKRTWHRAGAACQWSRGARSS